MGDVLAGVKRARAARLKAELAEHDAAWAAYRAGATWGEIGDVYGISKQAARKRFMAPGAGDFDRAVAEFDEETRILDDEGPEAYLAHMDRKPIFLDVDLRPLLDPPS